MLAIIHLQNDSVLKKFCKLKMSSKRKKKKDQNKYCAEQMNNKASRKMLTQIMIGLRHLKMKFSEETFRLSGEIASVLLSLQVKSQTALMMWVPPPQSINKIQKFVLLLKNKNKNY